MTSDASTVASKLKVAQHSRVGRAVVSACPQYSPDILSLIRASIAHQEFNTLPSLARTCRAFQEPALNALWSCLPSITPLILTLPPDAWMLERVEEANHPPYRIVSLRRSLVPSDFKRTMTYAQRVQTISDYGNRFHPARFMRLSPGCGDALATISQHLRLPRLKSLKVGGDVFTGEQRNDLVLGSSISSIELLAASCAEERETPMNQYDWEQFGQLAAPLSTAVQKLEKIVVLDALVVPLLPEALLHMTSIANLTTVSMRIRGQDYPWDALTHEYDSISFPTLAVLEVQVEVLDWFYAFLGVASLPSLSHVSARTN
ncbi:hypothetical protein BD413DRAFT_161701 [Trametes elegans]|nr:hypothetical protein BD413DRAFT_161701 [Trametes elegans]